MAVEDLADRAPHLEPAHVGGSPPLPFSRSARIGCSHRRYLFRSSLRRCSRHRPGAPRPPVRGRWSHRWSRACSRCSTAPMGPSGRLGWRVRSTPLATIWEGSSRSRWSWSDPPASSAWCWSGPGPRPGLHESGGRLIAPPVYADRGRGSSATPCPGATGDHLFVVAPAVVQGGAEAVDQAWARLGLADHHRSLADHGHHDGSACRSDHGGEREAGGSGIRSQNASAGGGAAPRLGRFRIRGWSGARDSNPGPHGPETCGAASSRVRWVSRRAAGNSGAWRNVSARATVGGPLSGRP
jgi:hypothetical protein